VTSKATKLKMDIKKILLTIGILASLFFGIVLLIIYRSAESSDKMVNKSWTVRKITIHGKDVTSQFGKLRLNISYSKKFPLTLPRHKEKKGKKTKNNWDYYRSSFFDGNFIFYDYKQEIFSGDYNIEILAHSTPKQVKLYSDSIELYLQRQVFTLENSTIKIDWD